MVRALHRKSDTCCFRQMSEFVGVSVRLIYAGVRVDRSCGIRKKHHIKSADSAFGYEKKLTEIVEIFFNHNLEFYFLLLSVPSMSSLHF
jgi:hypothetical protein